MKTVFKFFKGAFRSYRKEFAAALILALFSAAYGIFTLNQEEIQALLLEDQGEAFKKILQTSLNKILQAESAEQLKAGPYERSEERTDSRNGSRDRGLRQRCTTRNN